MKKLLVVEDELVALEDLKESILEVMPNLTIVGVQNVADATEVLRREKFDAMFLDIELPGLTGVQFLQRTTLPLPPVVLVTAHAFLAIDAFGLGVVECLLKPVDQERLARALHKLLDAPPAAADLAKVAQPASAGPMRIVAREGDRIWMVRLGDVIKAERSGGGTRAYFRSESGHVRVPFADFLRLLDPTVFFQANESTAVNLDAVDHFQLTTDQRVSAVFASGSRVEFGTPESRAFLEQHIS